MSKCIDQSEFGKIVAEQKGIDQKIVDAFIQELFKGIEKELITNSSVKIDELGFFRVIKSGSTKRILFLGATANKQNDKPKGKAAIISTRSIEKISSEREKEVVVTTTTAEPDKKDISTKEDKRLVVVNTPSDNREEKSIKEKIPLISDAVESEDSTVPSQNNVAAVDNNTNVDTENSADNRTVSSSVSREETSSVIRERNYSDYNVAQEQASQKSKTPIYIGLAILALLIIGTVVYKLFSPSTDSPIHQETIDNTDNKGSQQTTRFTEVANNDTRNLSCIIIVNTYISAKELSKIYYGNEIFWPYIYNANGNIMDENLAVQANTIVKIPKLTVDLVSYSTGKLDEKIKAEADKIMEELKGETK